MGISSYIKTALVTTLIGACSQDSGLKTQQGYVKTAKTADSLCLIIPVDRAKYLEASIDVAPDDALKDATLTLDGEVVLYWGLEQDNPYKMQIPLPIDMKPGLHRFVLEMNSVRGGRCRNLPSFLELNVLLENNWNDQLAEDVLFLVHRSGASYRVYEIIQKDPRSFHWKHNGKITTLIQDRATHQPTCELSVTSQAPNLVAIVSDTGYNAGVDNILFCRSLPNRNDECQYIHITSESEFAPNRVRKKVDILEVFDEILPSGTYLIKAEDDSGDTCSSIPIRIDIFDHR